VDSNYTQFLAALEETVAGQDACIAAIRRPKFCRLPSRLGGSSTNCGETKSIRVGFMHNSRHPQSDEVEQLLRNAELRDELERYFDESISRVNVQHFSLAAENEFLAAMLAWEQAPVLPIYRWFDPELRPPKPESLGDADLHKILWDVVRKLYQKRIVLDFTDHLTDRELYCLIFRDILPAREKKIDWPNNYLHWDCTGANCDPEVWLRYYATEEEREDWAETYYQPLPMQLPLPYPRQLPREPG
jgi:hypothetical protein